MTRLARAKTEHPKRKLNWAAQQRQTFIGEHLRAAGTIRREAITAVFGVSTATASTDLREWQRKNRGKIWYDLTDKIYRTYASQTGLNDG